MDKVEYWKNFSLGTELDISGSFIYNGLKTINTINNLNNTDEIFEFLYNISVGIERLGKIAIIFLEHNKEINQTDFEQKLKNSNHNHSEIWKRINENHTINVGKIHINFIALLSEFYNKHRYNRFNIDKENSYDKEKETLLRFIELGLNIKIINNPPIELPKNTRQIKSFLSKIIGKISSELYAIIYSKARDLNIYTYELRYDSKAFHVFIAQDFTFEKEN